jgi:hypothetical protein
MVSMCRVCLAGRWIIALRRGTRSSSVTPVLSIIAFRHSGRHKSKPKLGYLRALRTGIGVEQDRELRRGVIVLSEALEEVGADMGGMWVWRADINFRMMTGAGYPRYDIERLSRMVSRGVCMGARQDRGGTGELSMPLREGTHVYVPDFFEIPP